MMTVCRGGVLVALLVCLLGQGQLTLGQECEWVSLTVREPELRSADNEPRRLAHLPLVKDATGCQAACCARADCHYAVMANSAADGTPECYLDGCVEGDASMCSPKMPLQPTVFRKKKVTSTKLRVVPLSSASPRSETSIPARCLLQKLTGPCRAAFTKFHYDTTSASCKTFIYGGCDGNENNFDTKQECEAACTGTTESKGDARFYDGIKGEATSKLPAKTDSDKAMCLMPKVTGPCRASFPKYHYDVGSASCKMFIYGGCDGNGNNFDTEDECQAACSGVTGSSVPEMDPSDFSGRFGGHGQGHAPVAPFFLIATLAVISAVLLAAVVLITLRRSKLRRRPSTISDKVGLLPDEQSSSESLSIVGSPNLGKA